MFYYGYHLLGMHIIWWFVWVVVALWIFVVPYNIPGQRNPKDSPLDIIQKRYANGGLSTQEYNEMKANIENEVTREDKWLQPEQ